MSDRDVLRQALNDAIGWQSGLISAWAAGSPERAEAVSQVKKYRALLKRRYGTSRTPMERAFANATTVTLDELRRNRPSPASNEEP